MTPRADVVIGMDIGTTSAKAVVRTATHGSAAYVELADAVAHRQLRTDRDRSVPAPALCG